MNFTNFANNANSSSLPMWSYSDIVQKLSSVYCMGQLEKGVKEAQGYCFLSCQNSFSSPYSQNNKSDYCSRVSDMKVLQCKPQGDFYQTDAGLVQWSQMNCDQSILKKRKRQTKELDIKQRLIELRLRILNHYVTGFASSPKKAKSAHKKHLRRRSKYIGVSRNNSNWQALINVDQTKRYIGTFSDELEAAKAYDLYSVAMNGEEASLNFDYTAQEMLQKIEHYLEQNSE